MMWQMVTHVYLEWTINTAVHSDTYNEWSLLFVRVYIFKMVPLESMEPGQGCFHANDVVSISLNTATRWKQGILMFLVCNMGVY